MSAQVLTPSRRTQVTNVLLGSMASFGVTISGGVLALIVTGLLQWKTTLPGIIDDGLPLLMLVFGMLLGGRVAADVAGRAGVWCGVGAALLTVGLGMLLSNSTEAHGDAIEPTQVGLAGLVVLVLVGGTAWLTHRLRVDRGKPDPGVSAG